MNSCPTTIDELDDAITAPSDRLIETIRGIPGEFAILGSGGKMGFHISRMLQRCLQALGRNDRIFTVSRFGSGTVRRQFDDAGFSVIAADLSDPDEVSRLPQVDNAVFLAGVKFGTGDDSGLLQKMNVECPQLVADHFRNSRFVALSTGCVYSFTTPESGGSDEDSATDPPGAYARSCLGREAAFQNAADQFGTRSSLVRLNYSIDLRYGVLLDIARNVMLGRPVSVETGYVNVIWQGDAVDHILQSFGLSAAPPAIVNVTGPDVLSVRNLAERFGSEFGKKVQFEGTESDSAWLNNASRSHRIFGLPRVSIDQLVSWTAEWLRAGGDTIDKPTHFEVRSGKY